MSSYFEGLFGLEQAIVSATQGQESIFIAHEAVKQAFNAGGDVAVRQLAGQYGINYTPVKLAYGYVNDAWSITGEVTNSGLSPFMQQQLSQRVLETSLNSATDELVFETAKQVATKNGSTTFLSGAVKTCAKWLPVAGAIATGICLGWESYKEHPDFWTDLSESMFNTNDPNVPIEVIARAHAGGYTTAMKEKEISKIIQKMAEQGCFDYKTVESTITEVGLQNLTWSNAPSQGVVSALAINKALETVPNGTIVSVDGETTQHVGNADIIRGTAYIATNLPNTGVISKNTDIRGHEYYYYYLTGNITAITAFLNETTETVSYATSTLTHIDVVSGTRYYGDDEGEYDTGGVNVSITTVEADNELFTNDHSSSNLSLAPTATISQVIQELRNKQSDWYDNSWTQDSYNPETDSIETDRYYPLTIPWWDSIEDTNKPQSYDPSEAQKGKVYQEPDPKSQPQGKQITDNNEVYVEDEDYKPIVPNPPSNPTPIDPGGGQGGTSDRLWSVYNPTLSELNDLGAYLWSSNIIDILQKFLQNPMDAIISLHKVYCTPSTNGRENIALGYLDSGVEANVVDNQFVTIDCGFIDVAEYFADARDYDTPYTIVECYLPFIGIVKLKTEDIIGGKVNIVYTIDLYSGECLCKIFITKIGVKQLLYNFSGNCSMQIPLTGSDRTRLLSGALKGAMTGAFAGGGIGAVAGAVAGAWMGGTTIDRSSNFSANAGCMGIKKPYLIITRKYSYDAGYYNKFYGYPSNITVNLGSCKGFTKIKSVHINNILRATDKEKTLIEDILKQGIIIK